MQKLFLSLGAVMLLGAGCLNLGGDKVVSGDWYLAFDLPEGWIMADDYTAPSDERVDLDREISGEDNEIVLQNTDKPIIFGGIQPDEAVPADSYVAGSGTRIDVTRLDARRLIPDEAEDLGDGFFKLKLCEDNEDCTLGGKDNYEYYFDAGTDKYRFEAYSSDNNQFDEVEDIIRSAQVVTDMNGEEEGT